MSKLFTFLLRSDNIINAAYSFETVPWLMLGPIAVYCYLMLRAVTEVVVACVLVLGHSNQGRVKFLSMVVSSLYWTAQETNATFSVLKWIESKCGSLVSEASALGKNWATTSDHYYLS